MFENELLGEFDRGFPIGNVLRFLFHLENSLQSDTTSLKLENLQRIIKKIYHTLIMIPLKQKQEDSPLD